MFLFVIILFHEDLQQGFLDTSTPPHRITLRQRGSCFGIVTVVKMEKRNANGNFFEERC
jgi:hypothetical protein